MPLDCRLITDEPAGGAWNMAVDEALLESAAGGGDATLRLYQWAKPTLSLGYFQSYADRAGHATSAALPCVRRSSGGGALVHDRELTYSLTLPPAALVGRDTRSLYCEAHRAVIDSIRELGGDADRLTLCDPEAETPDHLAEPFLCFLRRADADLLVGGPHPRAVQAPGVRGRHKITGSAQRKRRGGLLQHGGVLLAQSAAAPELPGLGDLEIVSAEPAELAPTLARNLSARLGLRLLDGGLGPAETDRANQLVEEKHTAEDWVKKR